MRSRAAVQPDTALPSRRRSEARARRTERRLAIVRCDKCDAIASGVVRGGALLAANLPFYVAPRSNRLAHDGCGGTLRAYDTKDRTDGW